MKGRGSGRSRESTANTAKMVGAVVWRLGAADLGFAASSELSEFRGWLETPEGLAWKEERELLGSVKASKRSGRTL